MDVFSTRQAAKKLGISPIALSRYISAGKVPAPKAIAIGRWKLHTWTEDEIKHVRQLLPKIGRSRKLTAAFHRGRCGNGVPAGPSNAPGGAALLIRATIVRGVTIFKGVPTRPMHLTSC